MKAYKYRDFLYLNMDADLADIIINRYFIILNASIYYTQLLQNPNKIYSYSDIKDPCHCHSISNDYINDHVNDIIGGAKYLINNYIDDFVIILDDNYKLKYIKMAKDDYVYLKLAQPEFVSVLDIIKNNIDITKVF